MKTEYKLPSGITTHNFTEYQEEWVRLENRLEQVVKCTVRADPPEVQILYSTSKPDIRLPAKIALDIAWLHIELEKTKEALAAANTLLAAKPKEPAPPEKEPETKEKLFELNLANFKFDPEPTAEQYKALADTVNELDESHFEARRAINLGIGYNDAYLLALEIRCDLLVVQARRLQEEKPDVYSIKQWACILLDSSYGPAHRISNLQVEVLSFVKSYREMVDFLDDEREDHVYTKVSSRARLHSHIYSARRELNRLIAIRKEIETSLSNLHDMYRLAEGGKTQEESK